VRPEDMVQGMDGKGYEFIDTDAGLADYIEDLKRRGVKEVCVDLEGEANLHHYGTHLCLIQLFDGERAVIVDPMVIDDMGPMKWMLETRDMEKVMFCANFDVQLIRFTHHIRIQEIFDCQVAASLLGAEKLGLKNVVDSVLGIDLDKTVDGKKGQRSDWTRRPLSDEQLRYAIGDVLFLPKLKDELLDRMGKHEDGDRLLAELEERNDALEGLTFRERPDPHLRLPGARSLEHWQQVYLRHYYKAREEVAKALDKPSFWILSNNNLVDAARNPPRNNSEWRKRCKLFHRAMPYIGSFLDATRNAGRESGRR